MAEVRVAEHDHKLRILYGKERRHKSLTYSWWQVYSSGQKLPFSFHIHSVEIKRPRECALNVHKGIYLKWELLLHAHVRVPIYALCVECKRQP